MNEPAVVSYKNMLKSDETSSPSTESDSYSENNKNIDTVSKLFSNLLKNSETTVLNTIADSKLSTSITFHQNDSQLTNAETTSEYSYSFTDLLCQDSKNLPKSLSTDLQEDKCGNDDLTSLKITTNLPNPPKIKSLTASTETVVINKDSCTPFNSKIPILHPKSDPLDHYEKCRKHQNIVGLKIMNIGSLKRICSNSKIPVSKHKIYNRNMKQERFAASTDMFLRKMPNHYQQSKAIRTEKYGNDRYDHVKSKLAAYINRPRKNNCSKNIRSKSPQDKMVRYDSAYSNFSGIKRISSRTSLDTYTCDFKSSLPDLNYSDCAKSDVSKNYQKAREHLEVAAEHNRIKMENERIIAEHWRVINKHKQLMLEHEEKANEHTVKAIAHVLDRITSL